MQWNNVKGYSAGSGEYRQSPNEFYRGLARGVDFASSKYGGMEFAMALGGNEVSGYHTGPASIVGQIVGVRHSHLDNAGYSIDQKAAKKQMELEQMVDEIIKEDNSRGVFNSLVGCLFARGVYTEENIIDALGAVGIEKSKDDLQILGKRIFEEKYGSRPARALTSPRSSVPKRFYETVSTMGKVEPETVEGDALRFTGRREDGSS